MPVEPNSTPPGRPTPDATWNAIGWHIFHRMRMNTASEIRAACSTLSHIFGMSSFADKNEPSTSSDQIIVLCFHPNSISNEIVALWWLCSVSPLCSRVSLRALYECQEMGRGFRQQPSSETSRTFLSPSLRSQLRLLQLITSRNATDTHCSGELVRPVIGVSEV